MIRPADKSAPASSTPLNEISSGKRVRIVRIVAGHGLRNRLAAMGLLANESIEVIRNDYRGQVVVAVKGSKVVLGRGMSHKIFVQ